MGSPKTTIKDIAEKLDVLANSVNTISKDLNDLIVSTNGLAISVRESFKKIGNEIDRLRSFSAQLLE
jgi:predicted transcriptional regulator